MAMKKPVICPSDSNIEIVAKLGKYLGELAVPDAATDIDDVSAGIVNALKTSTQALQVTLDLLPRELRIQALAAIATKLGLPFVGGMAREMLGPHMAVVQAFGPLPFPPQPPTGP